MKINNGFGRLFLLLRTRAYTYISLSSHNHYLLRDTNCCNYTFFVTLILTEFKMYVLLRLVIIKGDNVIKTFYHILINSYTLHDYFAIKFFCLYRYIRMYGKKIEKAAREILSRFYKFSHAAEYIPFQLSSV